MKLVYLSKTVADFEWLRMYYVRVFPEGARRAQQHFHATEQALMANPKIGRRTEYAEIREIVIPRTPFSLIYRLRPERIEVLRIWDNRADRSALDPE